MIGVGEELRAILILDIAPSITALKLKRSDKLQQLILAATNLKRKTGGLGRC